jgi:hypothetical protein
MKSTKCPQCGLVYWNTAPNCKRCGLPTPGFEGESPVAETQHNAAYDAPNQTNYYTPQSPVTIGDDVRSREMMYHLKRDASVFYFIGGLQAVAWLVVGDLLIVDAVLNIGLAFVAYKFRSRVAAIFLMTLTLLSVGMAVLKFTDGGGISSPLVPVILIGRLFISGRILQTTFALKKYAVETFVAPPPPPRFNSEGAPEWGTPASSTQWQ